MKDPTPDILRRLERYRDRNKLSDYKVGMMVCGSGTLLKRLRGGNVTVRTLKLVDAFLAAPAPVTQKDAA